MNEGDCNVSRDSLSDWSDLDEVPGENLVVTETPRESQSQDYCVYLNLNTTNHPDSSLTEFNEELITHCCNFY